MSVTDSDGHQFRFLGMTKLQALYAASTVVGAALVTAVFLLSVNVHNNSRRADAAERRADAAQLQAQRARVVADELYDSACALQLYAEEQVQSTEDFLEANPGPEPIPGVTRQALLAQLARQRSFRDSLNGLECPRA